MRVPNEWEVIILENGCTYHKCDDGLIFKSFLSMQGTVFERVNIPTSEIKHYHGKFVSITHVEFGNIMRMVYQVLSEREE